MLDLIAKAKQKKTRVTAQMSRDSGIAIGTLRNRVRLGWSVEKALSEPVQDQSPVLREALKRGVKTYHGSTCVCGNNLRSTHSSECLSCYPERVNG